MNEQISINAPVYECSYGWQNTKNTWCKILFSSSKSRAYDSQCNGIYKYAKCNHAASCFQCQIKKIHPLPPYVGQLYVLARFLPNPTTKFSYYDTWLQHLQTQQICIRNIHPLLPLIQYCSRFLLLRPPTSCSLIS